MCNESNDSQDGEDFNDRCGVSKYPLLHEFKACSSKVMDKWIQCDMWAECFHLIRLHENVAEDDFVSENCCWDVNGIIVMKI